MKNSEEEKDFESYDYLNDQLETKNDKNKNKEVAEILMAIPATHPEPKLPNHNL